MTALVVKKNPGTRLGDPPRPFQSRVRYERRRCGPRSGTPGHPRQHRTPTCVYFSKQRGACTLTRFADCAAQRRTGEVTEYKLVRRRVAEGLYGRANGDVFEIRIADESTQLVRVAEAEGSGGDRPCRLRTNMARKRVGSDRKPPASLDRSPHTEN